MLRQALVSLLAPPLCGGCANRSAPRPPLCEGCRRALELARPQPFVIPGVALALAAAPYDGIGRRLVGGLKFAGRLPLAAPMAIKLAAALEPVGEAAVVPVPPAPGRSRRRGFDPARELAASLARVTGRDLRPCLARSDGPRQVGRTRALRLADPPDVRLVASPPPRVLVVDDVVTTGATLAACARTLSDGGAQWIAAVAFARSRPNPRD